MAMVGVAATAIGAMELGWNLINYWRRRFGDLSPAALEDAE
jgi:hypothetical protein